MKSKDLVTLILLGAIWGSSFLFIRVAVPALGPFLLVELRVGLAALALAPFAVALGCVPEVRSHWRQFLVVGMLNAAVPFSLIAFRRSRSQPPLRRYSTPRPCSSRRWLRQCGPEIP